eukprot:CAMPEP_0174977784 /NCGR_PEP_ID=MMETSP0004_2-20121128/13801_1 /TAXON_ID=420556 /ORGANISM="Ochromonas sp., Strain CCMP1393" /LENGTH=169 /DNA_ID=CAMNT_0016229005 /DNA_START=347 /DNA_END=853 /DNA_ORIENTATION=-
MRKSPELLKEVIDSEDSPWLVFFLRKIPHHNPAKSVKLVKMLGAYLFPNAEWIIYLDAKTKLTRIPTDLFEAIDRYAESGSRRLPLGIQRHGHRERDLPTEFVETWNRMKFSGFPLKDIREDLDDIKAQKAQYEMEGFLEKSNGVFRIVDSHIIVFRNTWDVKRFLCAW